MRRATDFDWLAAVAFLAMCCAAGCWGEPEPEPVAPTKPVAKPPPPPRTPPPPPEKYVVIDDTPAEPPPEAPTRRLEAIEAVGGARVLFAGKQFGLGKGFDGRGTWFGIEVVTEAPGPETAEFRFLVRDASGAVVIDRPFGCSGPGRQTGVYHWSVRAFKSGADPRLPYLFDLAYRERRKLPWEPAMQPTALPLMPGVGE